MILYYQWAFTQRPLMLEDEIKKWLNLGMDIGAHTKTHADLTIISEHEAYQEINHCKADLERRFKVVISDFCYPFGRFNDSVCRITKNSGYLTATTMTRGRADFKSNVHKLPRIPITHHTLPHLFLAKILTNYEDKR